MRRIGRVAIVLVLALAVFWFSRRPSLDRDWLPEQSRIASAERVDGNLVRVRNVRNFRHCEAEGEPLAEWEERRLDLRDLDSLWFVLSPFGRDFRGPAHPFLSFGFGDSAFVSVSVEARKEVGEHYSIWRGMARQYELMYVVADERDVLGLRVFCYEDDVYLYPVRTTPERACSLFVDLLARAEELGERPEFYDTVWNNCTTNLVEHANKVSTKHIPGGLRVVFPGYTDEIALSLGLLDAEGDVDDVRARYRVNDRVRAAWGEPDFFARVRQR
jgi:hypothetical protein